MNKTSPPADTDARQKRLQAALRDNLKRRKAAQASSRLEKAGKATHKGE